MNSTSLAGRLAEELLKAWLSGDVGKIHAEFERCMSVPVEAHDTGEQERRQLLQAVAGRMMTCSDLLEIGNDVPNLELLVQLLGHMVRWN